MTKIFIFTQDIQDGAAIFGRRPGRSAKTILLFTFDFYFYTQRRH